MAQKDHLGVAGTDSRSRRRSKSPSPSRKKKNKKAAAATGATPTGGVLTPGSSSSSSNNGSPPPSEKLKTAPLLGKKPVLEEPVDEVDPGVKDNDIFLLPSYNYTIIIGLTILAVAVRLFRIYQPSSVVFDEVHFGGFATKYIKGKFFMDVHPPLAKLLITLAGWLAGFDGSFDFKEIGKDYLEPGVPYVAMRMLPALCGIAVVPTIFLTLKAAGCSTAAATLAAGLIIFDNALATQSRLILLDAPLVIFTAFTGLAWTCFLNVHELGHKHAFGANWWFWLACTGLGLGATASVKWVGLFTIAWVGSLTILQLWVLLGDTKNVSASKWFKHFFARAFCLIVIPVSFYMGMFVIHFMCLRNPGEGDGFMSSEFQATLNNKGMSDVPADVLFGSKVTLRHWNTQGGYLHSHASMYPTGSKQQQITLYPHKDENNMWIVENQTYPDGGVGISGFDDMDPFHVVNGAILKLYHIATDRRLHSHDHRPPVTEADWQNEVSAYGHKGFEGDSNDMFRVEIVKKYSEGVLAKERVRTIQTKFRLIHIMTGCALFSHKVKLPNWGFEQQEVTCAKGATLPNSIWYIESNEHPKLDETAERVNYRKPGFLAKFWELNKVMWKTNAGLVESHAWDSRPDSWPILRRGINFWGKDHRQIYLIGNPLIWWTSTATIVAYILFKGVAVLRWQRGYSDYRITNFRRFDYEVGVAVLAWAFHYFPFFLMQRQLFLHHYLPALYFAVVALAQVFDFVAFRVAGLGLKKFPVIGWTAVLIFLAGSAAVFTLYSPLVYGNPWTKSACKQVKLFSAWDWDCNTFLDNYSDYGNVALQKTDAPTAAIPPSSVPSSAAVPPPPPPPPPPPAPPVEEQIVAENQQPLIAPPAEPEPIVEEPEQSSANGVISAPDELITPFANDSYAPGLQVEEHIEYRDQNGNLLNEEQVAELEGQVEFETKYETKYRVQNEDGSFRVLGEDEVPEQAVPQDPVAVEQDTVLVVVDEDGNVLPDQESAIAEISANPELTKSAVVHTVYVDDNGVPLSESAAPEQAAKPSKDEQPEQQDQQQEQQPEQEQEPEQKQEQEQEQEQESEPEQEPELKKRQEKPQEEEQEKVEEVVNTTLEVAKAETTTDE